MSRPARRPAGLRVLKTVGAVVLGVVLLGGTGSSARGQGYAPDDDDRRAGAGFRPDGRPPTPAGDWDYASGDESPGDDYQIGGVPDAGGEYAAPGRRPVAVPPVVVPDAVAATPDGERPPRWQVRDREPSDLVLSPDERYAYVVNAAAGTLSVLDLRPAAGGPTVVDEVAVGGEPRRLIRLPEEGPSESAATRTPTTRTPAPESACRLLVADTAGGALIVLAADGPRVTVAGRVPTVGSPAAVAAWRAEDGVCVLVGGLWSRQAQFLRLDDAGETRAATPSAEIAWTADLDFSVGDVLALPAADGHGRRVLLTDRFGGRLALLDADTGTTVAAHRVYGHAMRGLGVTGDGRRLLLAHQMVNEHGHTIKNDIHWGMVVTNDLRWMDVAALDKPGVELYATGRLMPIGEPNHGAADPEDVALSPEGTIAVAIGGMHELAVGREGDFRFDRVRVARRPTAVAITADGTTAVVACGLDDAVCVVDAGAVALRSVVGLGPRPARSDVALGREVFHDGRFGLDGWMSCASCHVDGHSCHLLSDTRGDDSFGAPKRIPSLAGVAGTAPFGWEGKVATLEAQIDKSLASTQHSPAEFTDAEVRQVAAYLTTLAPAPGLSAARRDLPDGTTLARGRAVFEATGCADCHAGPELTAGDVFDVGLADAFGHDRFNPPSLAGVSQRDALLHDGSASDLDGLLDRHPLAGGRAPATDLPPADRAALLAYLRSR